MSLTDFYQLQAFQKFYPDENIQIIDSDELDRDTKTVLSKISVFLGISCDFNEAVIKQKFHLSRHKKRNPKIEQILINLCLDDFSKKIVRRLFRPFHKYIQYPKLSQEDRSYIAAALKNDLDCIRGFTGSEFANWSL